MHAERESDNNAGLATPNKLPSMTREKVMARAKAIFDLRGPAPYESGKQFADCNITDGEVAVISEFVYYWQPYFAEKPNASSS